MTMWKKHYWRATACGMILILQTACAKDSAGDFCLLYRPVYTAAADTEHTRQQADGNNAVWMTLCAPRVSRHTWRDAP